MLYGNLQRFVLHTTLHRVFPLSVLLSCARRTHHTCSSLENAETPAKVSWPFVPTVSVFLPKGAAPSKYLPISVCLCLPSAEDRNDYLYARNISLFTLILSQMNFLFIKQLALF